MSQARRVTAMLQGIEVPLRYVVPQEGALRWWVEEGPGVPTHIRPVEQMMLEAMIQADYHAQVSAR